MKNLIVFRYLMLVGAMFISSVGFAGHSGGIVGLQAVKAMMQSRGIDGGGLVGIVEGGNGGMGGLEDALLMKLSGHSGIFQDASIVSEYRTGDVNAFRVNWEDQTVDFEDVTATFEEVSQVAEEIVEVIEAKM